MQDTHSSFSQTIRIVRADGKIKIVRFNLREHGANAIVEIYDVKSLVSGIRDAMLVYNFNAMLENTNDFIYFKDANHLFTGASKTLVNITSAQSQNELIGTTDYEVFERAYADEYFKLERAIYSGAADLTQEYQPFITNDGKQGWVDNRKYPIKDADGNIMGLFGIARILSEDFKKDFIPKELLHITVYPDTSVGFIRTVEEEIFSVAIF